MQTQPKSERRTERVQRARQARGTAEDAFKGGDTPRTKLGLKSPWLSGAGRLMKGTRSAPSEE